MQKGNVKIMALAAVVIVVCLLVSYVYTDGGYGRAEVRSEMALGDYFEYRAEADYPDGTSVAVTYTLTMVGLIDDTAVMVESTSAGDFFYYTEPWSGLVTDIDLESMEPLCTEDVETAFAGTLSCEVYDVTVDGQEQRVWKNEDLDLIVKTQVDYSDYVQTTVLWDTSITSPAPEYGSSTLDLDVVPGDICSFEVVGYDTDSNPTGTGVFVKHAESVEDDVVTYTWFGSEAESTCDAEDFAGMTTERTPIGTALVETGYGPRVCNLYAGSTTLYYIGADDGVNYGWVEFKDDGTYRALTLTYSSCVAGDMDADGFRYDWQVGDTATTVWLYTYPDGSCFSEIYVDTIIYAEGDDVLTERVYNWYSTPNCYDSPIFTSSEDPEEPVGVRTVNTIWGPVECDMYVVTQEDGSVVTYCVWDDELIVWMMTEYPDGAKEEKWIAHCMQMGPEPSRYTECGIEEPEVGDTVEYALYADDGTGGTIGMGTVTLDVVSVADGNITTSNGVEEVTGTMYGFLHGFEEGTADKVGQTILTTQSWGDRVCDIYTDAEAKYYLGTDGVLYGIETDGFYIELVAASYVY